MDYVIFAELTESVRIIRNGRIGKIVNRTQHGSIGVMLEIAFENQLWTECYWSSETESL